ncbi:tail fiber domain-containing protein [Lewinella sp. 4G2]|uniref:tail fiber domain-containing protein n=1 Tax=Lewinella sp. 4G2 TaxID=1803372 RepID=UPI0007B47D9E|nr:tail fiber domain-containing protein [Lewinella sp. 4G2]OAV43230.1 hypothetical protein A3850_001390 [Lewinella sp. 4G2]
MKLTIQKKLAKVLFFSLFLLQVHASLSAQIKIQSGNDVVIGDETIGTPEQEGQTTVYGNGLKANLNLYLLDQSSTGDNSFGLYNQVTSGGSIYGVYNKGLFNGVPNNPAGNQTGIYNLYEGDPYVHTGIHNRTIGAPTYARGMFSWINSLTAKNFPGYSSAVGIYSNIASVNHNYIVGVAADVSYQGNGSGIVVGVSGTARNDVAGSIAYGVLGGTEGANSSSNTNYAGYFEGNVVVTGSMMQTSDLRLKTDIVDLNNAGDILSQLKPMTYSFLEDQGITLETQSMHYGFLAQEVEEVLPDLVTTVTNPARYEQLDDAEGEEGTMRLIREAQEIKTIRYSDFIAILVEGYQEQDKLISTQADLIESQQDEINEIRSELASLTASISSLIECVGCGLELPGRLFNSNGLNLPNEKSIPQIIPQLSESGYTIFPNPASKWLRVMGPPVKNHELRLFDASGRLLKEETIKSTDHRIELNNLPAGMYLLEIFNLVEQRTIGSEKIIIE